MPLEVVVRPLLMCREGLEQWHIERPLGDGGGSVVDDDGQVSKARRKVVRIIWKEGSFIEQEECDREWAGVTRDSKGDIVAARRSADGLATVLYSRNTGSDICL